jgi:hypothetical protein
MVAVCHTGSEMRELVRAGCWAKEGAGKDQRSKTCRCEGSGEEQFSTHCMSCHLLQRELEQPVINIVETRMASCV